MFSRWKTTGDSLIEFSYLVELSAGGGGEQKRYGSSATGGRTGPSERSTCQRWPAGILFRNECLEGDRKG